LRRILRFMLSRIFFSIHHIASWYSRSLYSLILLPFMIPYIYILSIIFQAVDKYF
jgi:hypothetical protein